MPSLSGQWSWGGHRGRGLHTELVCWRAPPPGLVRAPLQHAGVGSPAGRDPRGSRRLGALWRAVCRSSRIPPPPRRGPFWGQGGVPSAPGERRVAPAALKLGGGERGGGSWGAAPSPPVPPSRRASACHPLSLACPPGVYSCRGGCWAAAGVGCGQVGRQWVSAAGRGEKGGTPPPWFAPLSSPGRPLKGLLRLRRPGRRQSAVGLQRAGRGLAGGSPRALAAAAVPPHPGCSGLFGGGAGPQSLRSASVRFWARGGGGGEWGGPSGPLAPPPDGRGGGGWRSRPRGPAVGWGVAPFPRTPLPRV